MFDVVHQNMLWYVPLDHGVCVYFPTVIPTAPLLPCKVKTNQYPKAQYPWTFPWSAWQKSCRQCISWVQKHISPVSSRGRRSFGTNVLERWWFMRKNVEQVSKDQMIEILATLKLPLKKVAWAFSLVLWFSWPRSYRESFLCGCVSKLMHWVFWIGSPNLLISISQRNTTKVFGPNRTKNRLDPYLPLPAMCFWEDLVLFFPISQMSEQN